MRMPQMNRVLAGATMIAALCVSGLVAAQSGTNTVLKPADLEKLFPATVYYVGQSAPTQIRIVPEAA